MRLSLLEFKNFRISKPELLAVLLYVKGPKGEIGEEIVGKTRLMKLMFLLLKDEKLEQYLTDDFSFEAYKYGPFDSEIYDIINAFKELGVIEIKGDVSFHSTFDEDVENYDVKTRFKLTELGIKKTEDIVKYIPFKIVKNIELVKKKWANKPLLQLLYYVYSKYPEYAKHSEVHLYD